MIAGIYDRLDEITRDWLKIIAGNGIRLVFTFITGILLARGLGTTSYGYFHFLISLIVVAGAVSDLGLTASASYHIPKWLRTDRRRSITLGQSYFWLRGGAALAISMLFGILGLVLVPAFSTVAVSGGLMVIAGFGVFANAVNDGVKTFLQVDTRFSAYSRFTIAGAGLTLLMTGTLIFVDRLNLSNAVVFLLIAKELIIAGLIYLSVRDRWSFKLPSLKTLKRDGRRLSSSGIWIWFSNIIEKMGGRADLFLIPFWLSGSQLGIYALAFSLSRRMNSLNHHLYTVILPRTSRLNTADKRNKYVNQSLIRSTGISVVILVLIAAAEFFIPFFYGTPFNPAVNLFRWLGGVVILETVVTPFILMFHSMQQENKKMVAESIKTGSMLILMPVLIPVLGLYGVVIARGLATACYGTFVIYKTKNYL